ncbi:hypothetical protein GOV11_02675 [Candidatus Woesearchaeota archaeon]|nr:hypothetical protein [Candidatus Woesearchaeota archaeon]
MTRCKAPEELKSLEYLLEIKKRVDKELKETYTGEKTLVIPLPYVTEEHAEYLIEQYYSHEHKEAFVRPALYPNLLEGDFALEFPPKR